MGGGLGGIVGDVLTGGMSSAVSAVTGGNKSKPKKPKPEPKKKKKPQPKKKSKGPPPKGKEGESSVKSSVSQKRRGASGLTIPKKKENTTDRSGLGVPKNK